MAVAVPISLLSSAVRASSVDTQKRPPYNPHRTYPKKPDSLTTANSPTTPIKTIRNISISDLLRRDIYQSRQVEMGGTYLGYETWLPSPQKVEKPPRSVFNPTSLAYIGDCIYELNARRHFLLPPLDIEQFNNRVVAVVRCEAQDAMLQKPYKRRFFVARREVGIMAHDFFSFLFYTFTVVTFLHEESI